MDGKSVAKRTFKSTSGEKAPYWVTVGLWTRAVGQCGKEMMVVHHSGTMNDNFRENLNPLCTVWVSKSGTAIVQ